MQLLLDYTASQPAEWQSGFDARAEARGQAGLTLLQAWRSEDEPGKIVCLFELRDRKRAEDWLAVETSLHGAGSPRFLRTL